MAAWERQAQKTRRKAPSFSSSLLDAIYHSTDESRGTNMEQQVADLVLHRRNNASQVEEEIESLRKAIMIEKWIENHSACTTPRHLPSNSGSSTDSSIFSASEAESCSFSKSTPNSYQNPIKDKIFQIETAPKREGRFTRTKSRALKIYGDLKKVKEPISPGRKIANFLNSIFSPRNGKKNQTHEEWSSLRKSRSMKDPTTRPLASRSCLSRNPSSSRCDNGKSKRSVRFCPVSVIVDEDSRPCGQRTVHEYDDEYEMGFIGSQFIKKNIDSFRVYEGNKNVRRHEFREMYDENESDVDNRSCASSDLFELQNIGRVGIGKYDEELPVYGTTSLKLNQAIAHGFVL